MNIAMIYAGAAPAPQNFSAQLGSQYTPNAQGVINVAPNDIVGALQAGWTFALNEFRVHAVTTPAAATVGRIVASAALSNGVLTIANQPDVMRPIAPRIDPGTSAITAGTLTLLYVANDGTATTDVLSLAAAASTPITLTTSKGVLSLTSATVAALAGGTSPKVEISTNASLAVPVSPSPLGFIEVYEATDGTGAAIGTYTAAGIIKPATAPNATHSYSFGYSFYFS